MEGNTFQKKEFVAGGIISVNPMPSPTVAHDPDRFQSHHRPHFGRQKVRVCVLEQVTFFEHGLATALSFCGRRSVGQHDVAKMNFFRSKISVLRRMPTTRGCERGLGRRQILP